MGRVYTPSTSTTLMVWSSNQMYCAANAAMFTMRSRYVLPGSTDTVTFWPSLMRAASGTGSAPVGLVYDMNRLISAGICSWYQSESVRTISES